MDALGKWSIGPFAHVASTYLIVLQAPKVLSFAKTSFCLCWQHFIVDLFLLLEVKAACSCATTSPSNPLRSSTPEQSLFAFHLLCFCYIWSSFLAGLPQHQALLTLLSWSWLRVLHPALNQPVLPSWMDVGQLYEHGFWQCEGSGQ